MANSTVSKNKTASLDKYSYKYTDLAQIHEAMEEQGLKYYQFIEPFETSAGLVDYIYTTICTAEGEVLRAVRGCRVVDANGQNPTQEHGKAITYARRYSLLMALGWATDDDDAVNNVKTPQTYKKPAQAQNQPFTKMITDAQRTEVEDALDDMGLSAAALKSKYSVGAVADMTEEQFKDFIASYKKYKEGKSNA